MSDFANKVKMYYDRGLWSLQRVQKALELNAITQAEYDEIVGTAV